MDNLPQLLVGRSSPTGHCSRLVLDSACWNPRRLLPPNRSCCKCEFAQAASAQRRADSTARGPRVMPTMAAPAVSAPSSLRISHQGMIGGGQGWGGRCRYGSRPQRAIRGATVSPRASMNITCCANQTQTAQRKSYSGPTSPPSGSVKEKVKPRLDDGGVGFPPFRFGGGGGGGGGGGSSSSGGFILFVIVLLLDYLKEFERNLQNGPRRGSDYDDGFAPQ